MIFVRSIDFVEVPSDTHAICKQSKLPVGKADLQSDPSLLFGAPAEFERIHGEAFQNARGQRVVIGLPMSVREILGLPLGCFERNQVKISGLEKENNRLKIAMQSAQDLSAQQYHWMQDARAGIVELEDQKTKVRRLGFWKRLRVLFGADPFTLI